MKKLVKTDYVLYDIANDSVVRFESDNAIVIYGDIDEAYADCRGNEYVTPCTDLPKHWQEILLKQINNLEV